MNRTSLVDCQKPSLKQHGASLISNPVAPIVRSKSIAVGVDQNGRVPSLASDGRQHTKTSPHDLSHHLKSSFTPTRLLASSKVPDQTISSRRMAQSQSFSTSSIDSAAPTSELKGAEGYAEPNQPTLDHLTSSSSASASPSFQNSYFPRQSSRQFNPDRIRVYGSPDEEDGGEAIVRSVLPGGIVRLTGIENPRLGSYVNIHLASTYGHTTSVFATSYSTSTPHGDFIPPPLPGGKPAPSHHGTIRASNNIVRGEIIHTTKHETFVAVECDAHLISNNDKVSKCTDDIPSVPLHHKVFGRVVNPVFNPLDAKGDIGSTDTTQPSIYAPIYDASRSALATKYILETKQAKRHHHPIYTTIQRLNDGTLEPDEFGESLPDQGSDATTKDAYRIRIPAFQKLYDSFDGEPTYTTHIDDDEDVHTSIFSARDVGSRLFIEKPTIPLKLRASATQQIVTGIPQIDLLHPIRKGMRVAISSESGSDLSTFAATMIKNILNRAKDTSHADNVVHKDALYPEQAPRTTKASVTNDPMSSSTTADGLPIPQEPTNDSPEPQAEMADATESRTALESDGAATYRHSMMGDQKDLLNVLHKDKTVCVYVCLGKTAPQKEAILKILDPVLDRTVFIYSNDQDTPCALNRALQSGIELSNQLRNLGYDAIAVIDELSSHAKAFSRLHSNFGKPNHHMISSNHALHLDSMFALEKSLVEQDPSQHTPNNPGSSSAIVLYQQLRSPIPTIEQAQSDKVLEGLKSTVDHTITFNDILTGKGFWPPIEVSGALPILPNASPVLKTLIAEYNKIVVHSQHLQEFSQLSEGLGIPLDEDVLQVIDWRGKVQALLLHAPSRDYTLVQQYIMLISSIRPRLLVGIDLPDIPTFRSFLLKEMGNHASILQSLRDILNTAVILPHKGYSKQLGDELVHELGTRSLRDADGDESAGPLTGDLGLPVDLERQLTKAVDDTMDKFIAGNWFEKHGSELKERNP